MRSEELCERRSSQLQTQILQLQKESLKKNFSSNFLSIPLEASFKRSLKTFLFQKAFL